MVSRNSTSKRHRGGSESEGEDDHRRHKERKSRSPSPKREKRGGKEKSASPAPEGNFGDTGDFQESMSIEETNKLRAKLGLAPLDTDDKPKERLDEADGLTVYVEDGTFEFKHKPSENWGEKKRQEEIRLKLEAAKKRRELEAKMFKGKAKGLADSDSDDDTSNWVNKLRNQEEEARRAAEREKMLNDMDEDFGVTKVIEKNKKPKAAKAKKTQNVDTSGMVIGHSREAFKAMTDQILVLEDKSVLDEGDETLVNPNMIDNERHARNVELRKRKDPTRNFDEDLDQYGNRKDFGVLSKYDEELEGVEREKFRLDEAGGYDVDKEEREAKIRHELEMANKKLVSLDMPNKYKLATEFYTQEEMISFRKPKKVKKDKLRKRGKMLKADDLIPQEPAGGSNSGSRDRGSRRRVEEDDGEESSAVKKEVKEEEPGEEMETNDPRWKKAGGGLVDLDRLKKLAQRDSDEDSDDEFGNVDLSNVVVEDDARDELSSILEKTRRLKHIEVKKEADAAEIVHKMMESYGGVKMEVDSDGEEIEAPPEEGVIRMDTTSEYCRNIGENLTYGIAGNRNDDIDTSELQQEVEEENAALEKWKVQQAEKKEKKRQKKKEKEAKGGWREAGGSAALDSDDERELENAKNAEYDSSSDEDEDGQKKEYVNVLGKEADVSKGVGAMLKLAAQKGYLADPNAEKRSGKNLDHLRIQAKTQVDAQKYDIEDKYTKKLERMGTTSRGPVMPFCEKKDYNPAVNVQYVDNNGRVMEQKDAYRELSYKFHGRKPGKKQSEKRMLQREKKELLKQMNSSDTPLGTLSKQLKKQEQLQTPYLVLSGSGRSDHTSIKKD